MSEVTDVTFNLKVNTSSTEENIRELNSLLTTYVALARRAGFPPDMLEAIALIQRMRIALQTLHRSITMIRGATGLIAAVTGIGAFGLGALMVFDAVSSVSRGY